MRKILIASLFTLSATCAFAGVPGWITENWGTEDVSAGTVCKVKDIHVLTASAEDCTTIGGQATHTLTQSVEPITK
ncbi:hypothetical protein [Ciceribacter selenitireducens]|jgi:hypothetical protein|uniref:Secreted protein n=1 Tax=Ciceribacter selenitireducens ATCC BAA-1503 TaxID=1336235 RepID=A0A376ABD9_9HYPH|nr:hypothetical protein [Ciceribacter selenitireducens]SSC65058.1 unnamed protein product [Ciceribacter selenitireducens ATCC BAA-1503]